MQISSSNRPLSLILHPHLLHPPVSFSFSLSLSLSLSPHDDAANLILQLNIRISHSWQMNSNNWSSKRSVKHLWQLRPLFSSFFLLYVCMSLFLVLCEYPQFKLTHVIQYKRTLLNSKFKYCSRVHQENQFMLCRSLHVNDDKPLDEREKEKEKERKREKVMLSTVWCCVKF